MKEIQKATWPLPHSQFRACDGHSSRRHVDGRISSEPATELGPGETGGVDAARRQRKPRVTEKPVRAVRACDTPVTEAGADGG